MTDKEIRALIQSAVEDAVRPYWRALHVLAVGMCKFGGVRSEDLADFVAASAAGFRQLGATDAELAKLDELRQTLLETPDGPLFG